MDPVEAENYLRIHRIRIQKTVPNLRFKVIGNLYLATQTALCRLQERHPVLRPLQRTLYTAPPIQNDGNKYQNHPRIVVKNVNKKIIKLVFIDCQIFPVSGMFSHRTLLPL
jgi:hypothetical protein